MPGESFRFIHASDFHLETPLGDLDAMPPNLASSLASAPRDAAMAVFDAAADEAIDFLVLSGDLLNPAAAGPHGMSVLIEGFEKLAAAKTPVFWSAGIADDPARWPEAVPLPPSVTLFPKDRVGVVPFERAGRTICHVIGRSSEGRSHLHVPSFATDPIDDYVVAVGHGAADAEALKASQVNYWALGGSHNGVDLIDHAAVVAGSPQGRGHDEPGPHGYVIVDVDATPTTRTRRVSCDRFRYLSETVTPQQIVAVGSPVNHIGGRIAELANENAGCHLLIAWSLAMAAGQPPINLGNPEAFLQKLRREYGGGNPSAWTTRLTLAAPSSYPKSWQDEDTILGDFLRATKKLRKEGSLSLMPQTEEHAGLPKPLADTLGDLPAGERTDTIDAATLMGVELLRGGRL